MQPREIKQLPDDERARQQYKMQFYTAVGSFLSFPGEEVVRAAEKKGTIVTICSVDDEKPIPIRNPELDTFFQQLYGKSVRIKQLTFGLNLAIVTTDAKPEEEDYTLALQSSDSVRYFFRNRGNFVDQTTTFHLQLGVNETSFLPVTDIEDLQNNLGNYEFPVLTKPVSPQLIDSLTQLLHEKTEEQKGAYVIISND